MTTLQQAPTDVHVRARRSNLIWSWLWYAALPGSFLLGLAAAHIPSAITGLPEGSPGPWWANMLAAALAIGILWIPVGLSLLFGRRAVLAGSKGAWVPVVIDIVLTIVAAVLIVGSAFD